MRVSQIFVPDCRMKLCERNVKLRWINRHFSDLEISVEFDNTNSIHGFDRFEEDSHIERKHNNFKLIGLTREELYTTELPAMLDDEKVISALCLLSYFLHQPYSNMPCNKNS